MNGKSTLILAVALGLFAALAAAPASAQGCSGQTCLGSLCTICGTDAGETIYGTTGADVICGLGGADVIQGDSGADVICGGDGNDTLYGHTDNDILSGGNGNDTLKGDNNNDSLRGDAGADSLDGGNGTDTASYVSSTAAITATLQNGTASDGDTLANIENLVGSAYDDSLEGSSSSDNTLSGIGGCDTLYGNGVNLDTCNGGPPKPPSQVECDLCSNCENSTGCDIF